MGAKLTRNGPVMVNFPCQLANSRHPDIWSNITLDISVKVFF